MIIHHSSLSFHHPLLITHHSKYPNFLPHLFGTYFQFLITQFFLLFVGPMPEYYVISFVSLPTSPSLSSFHFLPLQSPLPCYSHWSCPLSLSFLMYTHINTNNPIPNLRPNHHKHTNTNEYKHKLIGTHRCSNQNPQIPKSKITNTDLMPYQFWIMSDENRIILLKTHYIQTCS